MFDGHLLKRFEEKNTCLQENSQKNLKYNRCTPIFKEQNFF
ncbi:Uncharacterized protein dnl_52770 [Desulfonema limicola]|uniref:Uncharacterized protein n=1 Tax=Desulfonema limicola TaxID=45656 RepID=A0A975BCK3_9BACT|nr:Uncharacterized protein dnl_52770 [Desulfonema limicola]